MTQNIKITLGKRIRAMREHKGISQAELGRLSLFKREYLSNLEGDKIDNPTIKTISRIAYALDVSVADLISFSR